jgi:hypothetical protein
MISKFLSDNLTAAGVEYDYGDYAGAGFPPAQPITDLKAEELRRDAAEILAAQYLQTKESNRRVFNQRDKEIRAARRRFAYRMVVEHGRDAYTWTDGLSVRIENPILPSGRTSQAAAPMRVIFNR